MENGTTQKLSEEINDAITQLEYKIVELKTLKIEPDLSYLNSFYKERTEENINRLNSRIKIPKLSLYIWISSFVMLVFSFWVFLYVFSKIEETKVNSIKEYKNQLSKSSVIMSKENAELLKDMDLWFKSDPQSTSKFIHWRQNQK
ncbi:hypothetical protein EGI15_07445 [Chryseobacterium cucumeris]|uniref:Uncharacterized protein n=1 Tax=Chryseobacterium cucumeris TaxID=1813611 RepID=A0ABX9XA89_9FLAO|nr:hypothetical protein [Chryseobacterium cucumeris]ROH94317.1 hypothetical protein EGI15_07445 [Chryseobacterium cucumeris]